MKIKTEINMNKDDFIAMFYDHYIAEKDAVNIYLDYHINDDGSYDNEMTDLIINAMNTRLYDLRFVLEEYANEKCKINNRYLKNIIAFGLTVEYFGITYFYLDN